MPVTLGQPPLYPRLKSTPPAIGYYHLTIHKTGSIAGQKKGNLSNFYWICHSGNSGLRNVYTLLYLRCDFGKINCFHDVGVHSAGRALQRILVLENIKPVFPVSPMKACLLAV